MCRFGDNHDIVKMYLCIFAVAPHAGAWIEILTELANKVGQFTSLPTRERGLKYLLSPILDKSNRVAPHAGAWIEIVVSISESLGDDSRSPRGSVD